VSVATRVTPRKSLPPELPPVRLSAAQRARVHMLASLLLDYPDDDWFARLDEVAAHLTGLPAAITDPLGEFVTTARAAGGSPWQRRYVTTFDLNRKCSL